MVYRNDVAAFGWGFALVFLALCGTFTFLLVRDGATGIQVYPPDIPTVYPPWLMVGGMVVFWLGGLGFAAYAASKPRQRMELRGDGMLSLNWSYPFRNVVRTMWIGDLAPVQVVTGRDDEGVPYYCVRITLDDGVTLDILEGHDYERCEAACRKLNSAIGAAQGAKLKG